MTKRDPNPRGIPPADVERLIQSHVRRHTRCAVANLRDALGPLRERTLYHASPLWRAVEEAHRAAAIAERLADDWALRTAPDGDLFLVPLEAPHE